MTNFNRYLSIYLISDYDLNSPGEEFSLGWAWLGGVLQDRSDYELECWFDFLYTLGPWLFIHLSVSLFIQQLLTEVLNSDLIGIHIIYRKLYVYEKRGNKNAYHL